MDQYGAHILATIRRAEFAADAAAARLAAAVREPGRSPAAIAGRRIPAPRPATT
ncbi:MAG TPA: hypothetical protein VGP26_29595 [Actinophytocola sp.]|nr:hypothetical protein [Actinophytocola sp.]